MIGRKTMTNSASFIDLVVLDPIREHFVSGAILAVTNNELDEIIWANAAGAQAFGNISLVNAAGANTIFSRVQQRQILNGLHSGKANMVRIGESLVPISAQVISVGGENAVLLSAPQTKRHRNDADHAFGMIDGLDEAQSRTAILDRNANIVTATEHFTALEIPQSVLNDLITEVTQEKDRLVKRPIKSAFGNIPSAIAYLDDDRFLLMAIVADDAHKIDIEDEPEPLDLHEPANSSAAPLANFMETSDSAIEAHDVEATQADNDDALNEEVQHALTMDTEESEASSEEAVEASILDTLPQSTGRFVWKTDRENAIVEVSDSLLELIDRPEDALKGEEFQSMLLAHGVERGPIDTLMARQDTWSGVNVDFEIETKSLSVPVTLSALPQRDAENQFAGYRGFGLIRYKEAHLLEITPADEPAEVLAASPVEASSNTITLDAQPDLEPEEAPETLELFDQDHETSDLEQKARDSDALNEDAQLDNSPENSPETLHEENSGDLNDKDRATFAAIRQQLTANAPGFSPPAEASSLETAQEQDAADAPEATAHKETEPNNIVKLTPKPVAPKKPDNHTDTSTITPRFVPSAFAAIDLLPRQGNIDLVALDQLPLAIMLQRGDDIIYANDQLLNLTGFDDISDIERAGGLSALFEEPEGDTDYNQHAESRAVMRLKTEAQDGLDTEAHIQVVNFENSKALLLALVPLNAEPDAVTAPQAPSFIVAPTTATSPASDMTASDSRSEIEGLKSQIEELHGILDTATDGVILLDGVANIRSLNHSAEALFGYGTDDVRGRPFTTLFAIESHRGAMEYLTALTDNGVASVLNDGLEVIGREQEGRFIPLFMTLGRLAGSNGYCAVLRDITQWKRAEENLNLARQDAESASTQKSAFLARMSHEIRTPLNAIIGFSDLMLDDRFTNVKDERSKEYLKDINKSGSLVLDLVNDLLDLTKIESGEQEMEFSAVSINELLRESVSMMQPKANKQRVIIRSSLNSDLPDVVADARSVKQIALNLLSNAIRFTKAGGQVIASSAILSDGCVAIRIRDTGIGMTEDEISHAMQPYKQVKNEDVIATQEGSGLGLPLTKAMVEGNRAEMSITSTPDVGTIVEVIFPANRVLSE